MIASLHQVQIIPAALDQVWQFFATPRNLDRLTPPEMKFHIISELPESIHAGQIIAYQISVLPGWWMRWVTEIRQMRDKQYFADDQRIGPYKMWFHEHRFEEVAEGVKMTDHVTYSIGYGALGWLLHRFWIRRKLEAIFDFRRQAIEAIFGKAK